MPPRSQGLWDHHLKYADGTLCDFCSRADPEWVYPCESYELKTQSPGAASSGDWTACDHCSGLIERGAMEMLAARCILLVPSIKQSMALFGLDFVRRHVRAIHGEFLAHRRVERRKLELVSRRPTE